MVMNPHLDPPVAVLFERYSALLVAHTQAATLSDLVTTMRGEQRDKETIALVERVAAAAERRMDALDAVFPDVIDAAILDVVRASLSGARR